MSEPSRLSRQLKVSDAIVLGLGSMIGAGIFAAISPAAKAAGSGVILALAIAALVAFFNATSVAQLAAKFPESGGAYAYGRHQIGAFWGFLAGWGFIVGKLASCMAMALTLALYAFPSHPNGAAAVAVLVLTSINYFGIKKTAGVTRALLFVVLSILTMIVVVSWYGGKTNFSHIDSWSGSGGWHGLLEASGLLFFSFAGYARIATLGEEIVDPKRSIPKAILVALSITVTIYFVIIGTLVAVIPIQELAHAKAPLALAVERAGFHSASLIVNVGAAVASASVLLSLLAGISRTIFAMSSNGDLPTFLGEVHPKYKVPYRAELLVGVIVAIVVMFVDLRLAIGFSSFAVLIYYAIANVSALLLTTKDRMYPRWLSAGGLTLCLVLAFSLPAQSIGGGGLLFLIGILYYFTVGGAIK